MAEGTGESKLAYMAICLKTKQLQLNWAGSYGDQDYLGEAAEIKKRGKCFHTGNMGFPLGGAEKWRFLRFCLRTSAS
jgi:hypothetical protein